ncbi:MAG: DUF4160 domain-containing protein [Propionibacteriaceae bacterium]|nr:DUF4160 domain-containing protein [Propionibacteriaceae bacterium]
MNIQSASVLHGALPARQLKLVLAWCELHRDELLRNWALAQDNQPIDVIAPLS